MTSAARFASSFVIAVVTWQLAISPPVLEAQPAIDRYSDASPETPPGGASPPVDPGRTTRQLTFYADRGSFAAARPGLVLEDFSDTSVPASGITTCPGPLNSSTSNACFPPRAITAGLELDNLQGGLNVVLTPAFLGLDCVAVGPNEFVDDAVVRFASPVDAFGAEILCALSPNPVDIAVYGTGGLLGLSSASCGVPGAFWGVDSNEAITRIEFSDSGGTAGELFCDVEFGLTAVPAVPFPALLALLLLLLAAAWRAFRGALPAFRGENQGQ